MFDIKLEVLKLRTKISCEIMSCTDEKLKSLLYTMLGSIDDLYFYYLKRNDGDK